MDLVVVHHDRSAPGCVCLLGGQSAVCEMQIRSVAEMDEPLCCCSVGVAWPEKEKTGH